MRKLLTGVVICMTFPMWSQDTLKVLSLDNFLAHVRQNHPVVHVTSNNIEQAQQVLRMAKGAFDPSVFAGIDQKFYEGKTYYSTLSSGVKIPTRLGFNLKAMGDWNRGEYLNPQLRVPSEGLTYLGVEVPIGRGLFTDDRRTQLRRAEVALQQSDSERRLTLNDLLYDAGKYFLVWQEQHAQLELAREGLALAETRLSQVRISVQAGDRAPIDTLEAYAQFLNRKIEVDQRQLEVANARLSVEQYMWQGGTIPLQLDDSVRPAELEPTPPRLMTNDSLTNHPWLSWYDLKMHDLRLERRLKIEQLKPQLNLEYNLLQTPANLFSANYTWTNYKWGASFQIPIFLRKERASLAITRLKMTNTTYEQQLKQREIQTKLAQVTNDWNARWLQSESARQSSRNYYSLTMAERSLFELGESSLFLVNAREMSYLSAQSKYIEYAAKTQKSALERKYVLAELVE